MPHVIIKHFPRDLPEQRVNQLADALTAAVSKAFEVTDGTVSIALEPVSSGDWNDDVVGPDIAGNEHLVVKWPDYLPARGE